MSDVRVRSKSSNHDFRVQLLKELKVLFVLSKDIKKSKGILTKEQEDNVILKVFNIVKNIDIFDKGPRNGVIVTLWKSLANFGFSELQRNNYLNGEPRAAKSDLIDVLQDLTYAEFQFHHFRAQDVTQLIHAFAKFGMHWNDFRSSEKKNIIDNIKRIANDLHINNMAKLLWACSMLRIPSDEIPKELKQLLSNLLGVEELTHENLITIRQLRQAHALYPWVLTIEAEELIDTRIIVEEKTHSSGTHLRVAKTLKELTREHFVNEYHVAGRPADIAFLDTENLFEIYGPTHYDVYNRLNATSLYNQMLANKSGFKVTEVSYQKLDVSELESKRFLLGLLQKAEIPTVFTRISSPSATGFVTYDVNEPYVTVKPLDKDEKSRVVESPLALPASSSSASSPRSSSSPYRLPSPSPSPSPKAESPPSVPPVSPTTSPSASREMHGTFRNKTPRKSAYEVDDKKDDNERAVKRRRVGDSK